MTPKLSVITVVFNDVKHIEKTIQSVLNQDFTNIQYIIIDGGSTDGTVDVIKKYQNNLYYWHSKADKGLYDAMNKGLDIATGDYVLFLNSGDVFYDNETVSKIFASAPQLQDIYYGDAMITDEQGNEIGLRRHRPPEKLTWKSFVKGMLVSHQAFIPAMKIVEKYDLSYKIASDIDWCIRIMKKAEKIHNTRQIIVKFMQGGMSAKRRAKALAERFEIMRKHYGLLPTLKTYFVNSFKSAFFYAKHKRMM